MDRLTDDELRAMERHWHFMEHDPYYPSDPKLLCLIREVMEFRILEKDTLSGNV